MRIRKHAKISPLVYAATSSSLKSAAAAAAGNHVVKRRSSGQECQLNQSPWDVITFNDDPFSTHPNQPNLFRVNGDDNFLGNGSYLDSIEPVESVASMKLSYDGDGNKRTDLNGPKCIHTNDSAAVEGVYNSRLDAVEQLDSKNNNNYKNKKNAKHGEAILHDLHYPQLNNSAATTYTNTDTNHDIAAEKPRRRPRPKRSSSSLNADSYYYYSGFGPRWGKERGQERTESNRNNDNADNNSEHLEAFHENFSSTRIRFEEFNHIADEDMDMMMMNIADENEENRKKKPRKPIKARSLKSLM